MQDKKYSMDINERWAQRVALTYIGTTVPAMLMGYGLAASIGSDLAARAIAGVIGGAVGIVAALCILLTAKD